MITFTRLIQLLWSAVVDNGWRTNSADASRRVSDAHASSSNATIDRCIQLGITTMISRDDIRGAMARGYCSRDNAHKEIDVTLINAMADEVMPLLDRYTQQIIDRYISDGTTPGGRQ